MAEQRAAKAKTSAPAASPWLSDLLIDGSNRNLARRLAEFRGAVRRSLMANSKEFRVLEQLELASLPGSETCQTELRNFLADNPHFAVLAKLAEAERLVGDAAREFAAPR